MPTVITYQIFLFEPVLISRMNNDPNTAASLDYLTGSVLRGAVISAYRQRHRSGLLPPFFLDGSVRFLNAYPYYKDRATLPIPASWFHEKHKNKEIYDFAVMSKRLEMPERLKSSFYRETGGKTVEVYDVPRILDVHVQRDPWMGRPLRGKGAIFRYDALDANQSFQGQIVCDDTASSHSQAIEMVFGLLSSLANRSLHASLAKSRSAGYGDVKWGEPRQVSGEPPDGIQKPPSNGEPLFVTFLSDAILRNAHGQHTARPEDITAELEKRLEIQDREKLQLKDAFLSTEYAGGINRTWQLPTPQAIVVKKGTTLVYHTDSLAGANWEGVCAKGIGERIAEGYGVVTFKPRRSAELSASKNDPSVRIPFQVPNAAPTLDERLQRLTRSMLSRMVRTRLDAWLIDTTNRTCMTGNLSRSQIARFRETILRDLRTTQAPSLWQLTKLDVLRCKARRQIERVRVSDPEVPSKPLSLVEWLRHWLGSEDGSFQAITGVSVWSDVQREIEHENYDLGKDADEKPVRPLLDDSLRRTYTLRYLDAVFAKAAKESQRAENSGDENS